MLATLISTVVSTVVIASPPQPPPAAPCGTSFSNPLPLGAATTQTYVNCDPGTVHVMPYYVRSGQDWAFMFDCVAVAHNAHVSWYHSHTYPDATYSTSFCDPLESINQQSRASNATQPCWTTFLPATHFPGDPWSQYYANCSGSSVYVTPGFRISGSLYVYESNCVGLSPQSGAVHEYAYWALGLTRPYATYSTVNCQVFHTNQM